MITTLDDYSRVLLYGDLWEKESSWAHITSTKYVVNRFGCPLKYYTDNHSIFRYVEHRDTLHRKAVAKDETAVVQWREVLKELSIDVTYALSPAAKGKIERPYRWLQDHLVRRCSYDKVTRFEDAREILYEEIHHYNYKRVHSTTGEIPMLRYERALNEKKTVLKPFFIRQPFQSPDDIFCYRFKRTVDPYRKISFNNLTFAVKGAPLHSEIELRISFNMATHMALIRFWHQNQFLGEQPVKMEDLKKYHFDNA